MTPLFVLAAVGLTLIVAEGDIFEGLRKQLPFVGCYQCTGFWSGLILASFLPHSLITIFMLACASSVLSTTAALWLDCLQELPEALKAIHERN